ncbi:MAG: hypothetical protein FD180_4775 [Planctomycetota bacterium]|nr:MAG: hypothetical protein FD180_4775 [Planctomycetota bacterium]
MQWGRLCAATFATLALGAGAEAPFDAAQASGFLRDAQLATEFASRDRWEALLSPEYRLRELKAASTLVRHASSGNGFAQGLLLLLKGGKSDGKVNSVEFLRQSWAASRRFAGHQGRGYPRSARIRVEGNELQADLVTGSEHLRIRAAWDGKQFKIMDLQNSPDGQTHRSSPESAFDAWRCALSTSNGIAVSEFSSGSVVRRAKVEGFPGSTIFRYGGLNVALLMQAEKVAGNTESMEDLLRGAWRVRYRSPSRAEFESSAGRIVRVVRRGRTWSVDSEPRELLSANSAK